ncbi:histone deacetylase [Psychrosphaera haliotis]|uniref:Histone deacetylase n=1 Tax=Psychrosphaera haliotis TaxID=555083 RepID=A0A6N8F9R0_9GAMM|nr:histone deacetylase [Psychrosphaera haliotis]MUH71542.1 histone deacetylase [Psychrosphaera haliotis]
MKQLQTVFHPIYSQLTLPKNHRFPIDKYQFLHDKSRAEFSDSIYVNEVESPVTKETLGLIHSKEYIESFLTGNIDPKAMKRIGFNWSQQFVDRTRYAVAGTIKTARLALEHNIAVNFTGGYHHAHPTFGSGFCVFNDLSIAAKVAIEESLASRVLIFDCDVHQGDGTATCVEDEQSIFSLSIHCEKNFPSRKQQSDFDLGLEKHLLDKEYLTHVKDALLSALVAFKPDFIIYDAGVDIHVNDDLGLLDISTEGIYQRDKMVFETARAHNIPIMAVIGGGYQRDISALTEVHFQLIKAAHHTFL